MILSQTAFQNQTIAQKGVIAPPAAQRTKIQKGDRTQTNKLFFVCPFSFLDAYLMEKFGYDIQIYSTVTGYNELEHAEEIQQLRALVANSGITEIYLTIHSNCPIIHNFLVGNGIKAQWINRKIQTIFDQIENKSEFQKMPLQSQKLHLSKAMAEHQMIELMRPSVLGDLIKVQEIKFHFYELKLELPYQARVSF